MDTNNRRTRFCRGLLTSLGILFFWLPVCARNQVGVPRARVRIATLEVARLAADFETRGFDVLERGENALDLVVSTSEWEALIALGYTPVLVARGRPLRDILHERVARGGVPSGYLDLDGIYAEMNAVATAFPGICKVVDLTATYNMPKTFEGRNLFALKISDNVNDDENEPAMLVVSAHHCREIVTPVIALFAIEQLTSLYGTDPQVTEAVNQQEIWIAPVWNPDGYHQVFTGDNLWRKNRRVFATGIGVDLNRNYPLGWDSACSGSTSVGSQTYKGPSPASEPETRTMMTFSEDRHFARIIDYHSSGREVLWGYLCNTHPFTSFMTAEAITLSNASGYQGDNRQPSAEGEHFQWQINATSAHSFLIETHTSFQPAFTSAEAEAQLVWPGILWMLQRPISLWGNVTDADTGNSLAANLTFSGINFPAGDVNRSNDRFGRYHAFLPAGVYEVSFSAEGYSPQSQMVDITGTDGVNLNVALMPEDICRGDLTGDDLITVADLAAIINVFGQSGGPEDLNSDGTVDIQDLLDALPGWGHCLL